MLASLVLTFVVIEVPPIAHLFGFANIDWIEYLVAMGLARSVIPIVEFVKLIQRSIAKNKANKKQ